MTCTYRRIFMKLLVKIKACATVVTLVAACGLSTSAQEKAFNKDGNILISDQFNNRVIEVDPNTHDVIWQFGDGSSVAGPHSVVGVNDAQRVGPLTLIAGTGAPAGSEPTCPNGCPDNRVMLVNPAGHIVWQYGQAGVSGSGFDQLNTPVQNTRLPNGNTLITDSNNNRILEVDSSGNVVFTYNTNTRPGSVSNPLPTRAVRLKNGNTLISDQFNMQVIEIDPNQNIVFTQGTIGVPGNGFDLLNAPYDAKVVGDYTGLTPPFSGKGH